MTERPTMIQIYMDFAKLISQRSTCRRKQVGTVITSEDFEEVYAVGYNGNAKGFENDCDSTEPGNCGCLHSEINALTKCGHKYNKVVFVTMAPCKTCAKLMVNNHVSGVYFSEFYRDVTGLHVLVRAGIPCYLVKGGEVLGPLNNTISNPAQGEWLNGKDFIIGDQKE